MASSNAAVFEKIYKDYLDAVAALDLSGKSELLGIREAGEAIKIPFFNKIYTITPEQVMDPRGERPGHAVSVILCQYLLLCPENPENERDLVTYKDFRDAAPYVLGFGNTAEKPIARAFSGKVGALEKHAREFGGEPCDLGISCDLAYGFQALPNIAIYMVFNDQDEDFPADCSLLFEKRAQEYLDMECLAMIGMVLAAWLADAAGKENSGLV